MLEHNNEISVDKLKILLATNLRTVRKERGITQEELAKITCIDRSQIAKYESGERLMGIDKLLCIAKTLKVSPSAILKDWLIEL